MKHPWVGYCTATTPKRSPPILAFNSCLLLSIPLEIAQKTFTISVFKVIEEMQRDAIKPTFQQTRNRSSLLPSVVVLPKIGTGRNEEGTQKAMPRSENGNLHQLPPSGSLFNTNLITKTAHQSTSAVEDSLEDRSYTGKIVCFWYPV